MAAKNTQESFLTSHDRQTLIFGLPLSSSEKFVLTALNAFVGSDGRCWPGIERLSKMTSLEVKTVRKVLARLRESGIVRSESRFDSSGRQTSNLYFVDFSRAEQIGGAKLGGYQKRPPQNDPREGTKNSPPGGTKIGGRTNPKEVTIEKEEEEFFNSDSMSNAEEDDRFELSVTASNPEEDPTPLPPAPAQQFEHPAISMERRLRGNAPAKRSGYTSLNPWNIDNDPNKIDPEFKAYLVNTSDYIKFDEKPSAIRVEQWVGMANKDEARRSMVLEAWNEFAAERDRIAAMREERAKLTQANDPESNAAYKRFEAAIARHPKSLRVEVTDYNWQGLKVNMWYRGIPIMTMQRFDNFLLREVAIGINRNGGKMPLGKLKQILQLEDWDDLFPDSIVAGREAA